jgi:hypothetical protein
MRRLRIARLIVAILVVAIPAAPAQIIPKALPELPRVILPVNVDQTVAGVTRDLDARGLADLRRLKVLELLRIHRRELEADPAGAPIVRSEVLALAPTDAAVTAALRAGFAVVRERALEGLDARILVFQSPAGVSTRRALKRLRALDPAGTYDYNHIYLEGGAKESEAVTAPAASHGPPVADAPAGARIGLVDGGLDLGALRASIVHSHGCNGRNVPDAHATAVASLILGATDIRGAAPGAELFAADVYCGSPTGGAIDAVAEALAWLAREHVAVINISLVGPQNATLGGVVRLLVARGHLIVAAVGNDGPAAPPLYPAAYPDVVGVTAVDERRRVLPEALRGKQVDFAAPGSDMLAAGAPGATTVVRGTSYASPIVAGLLAQKLREPDSAAARRALEALAQEAMDLGARGADTTYGIGLVGESIADRPADIKSNGRKP